jgi:hypothetical protein
MSEGVGMSRYVVAQEQALYMEGYAAILVAEIVFIMSVVIPNSGTGLALGAGPSVVYLLA